MVTVAGEAPPCHMSGHVVRDVVTDLPGMAGAGVTTLNCDHVSSPGAGGRGGGGGGGTLAIVRWGTMCGLR